MFNVREKGEEYLFDFGISYVYSGAWNAREVPKVQEVEFRPMHALYVRGQCQAIEPEA